MAQAAADQPQKLERVEVTGSNIKRTSKVGTSPIDTITAADIKATGAKTVLELMKTVPALGADGFNDVPNQSGFSRGVATASLRSLSATSTLILINGRRMTPAAYANPNNGTSTLYDLNSLPVSAIERVEIFKDGASAVYGSDAIGGVINFILKRNYQGFEASARMGANDDGEFTKDTVNATMGLGDYESKGWSFMLSADLTKRGATSMKKGSNDIQADDYRAINLRLNPFSSSLSEFPIFTKELGRVGSDDFRNTRTTAPVSDVRITTAGCDPSRLITNGGAVHGILSTNVLFGRSFCNFDLDEYTDVQSKGTDFSLFGSGALRLSNDMQAFVELGYSDSNRFTRGAPRATNAQAGATTNFLLGGLATPFRAILEIGHPDNPFNSLATPARAAVGIRFKNAVNGNNDTTNRQYRVAAGVRGTVLDTWDFETAVLWNKAPRKEINYGFYNLPVLRQMLGPNGRSLASINSDPNLTINLVNKASAETLQWDGRVSTEFGQLPGGPIGVAGGLELRREKLDIDPDPVNARGDALGIANTAVEATRDVKSAFFEVRLPALKSLDFDVAGRVDKYPSIKTNFVPKAGFKWAATDFLVLRGTISQGFRAPAVSQVAAGGAQFFQTVTDPIRCEEDGSTPKPGAQASDCARGISGVGNANPQLKNEKSRAKSFGFVLSPTKNFDFDATYFWIRKEGEVALASTQDVIDKPDLYPPGSIVRDNNPALLLDGRPNTGPILSVSIPWTNQGSTEVSGVDLDISGRFTVPDLAKFTARLGATYNLSYKREEAPGYVPFNVVGTNGGISDWATSVGDIPRTKLRFSLSADSGNHLITGAMNYVSSLSYIRRFDGSLTPPAVYSGNTCHYGGTNFDNVPLRSVIGVAPTATNGRDLYINRYPGCKTAAWTTFDIGYSYRGIKDLTLSVNVSNFTDEAAPYTPFAQTSTSIAQGYNSGMYSNTGRYFSISASYKFW